MRILLCIPFTGYVPPKAAYSLIPMVCEARKQGIEIDLFPIGLSLVYTARETAAKGILEDGTYSHLLFIDSDMVVPVDLITRLLDADKDIVSALAFKRVFPFEPCIFKTCTKKDATFYLDYTKGLIQVAGTGMACTLIKREVFEKLSQPWFTPMENIGEDLSFCVRAKDKGFQIWCDTELICGHITSEAVTEHHRLLATKQAKLEVKK